MQITKRLLASLLLLFTMCLSHAQDDVVRFVERQMSAYPESRLLDIYKSCFQDYMGAEHLVSDTTAVKSYLDNELAQVCASELMPWRYEPCGIDGNYVRVSLLTVVEGLISADDLLDAFIRSANDGKRPEVEAWRGRWNEIVTVIEGMQIHLPHFDEDKAFIDDILSDGSYAISHSPEYRQAYNPHYRIVARPIFDQEIKPHL